MINSNETCIACLTPAGRGAVATLSLVGHQAWTVCRKLWRTRSGRRNALPERPVLGQVWLGRLGSEVADEVVLTVKAVEPTPLLELHCHGGIEVVRFLIELFEKNGVGHCSWQEAAKRVAGEDIADLRELLANAPTARIASIVLDQYHGAFRNALGEILDRWHKPENIIRPLLERLVRYCPVGRHLTTPWRVVILGAPNAGKSSLANAIAGYQRSIVSPSPGTTRDLVTTTVAIDGWPIELVDTAGLRESRHGVERDGMALAESAGRAADLCLWVLDSSQRPTWPLFQSNSLRLVLNKIDLPSAWSPDNDGPYVRVSARTGQGMTELCQAISQWLVTEAPPPGAAVPYSALLCSRVQEAWQHYLAGNSELCRAAVQAAQRGSIRANDRLMI